MNDIARRLSERYATLLAAHLEHPDETMLEEAHELGRSAIAAGLGVLDMVMIHHKALGRAARKDMPADDSGRLDRAAQFFGESLSAFEMMLRGYRETNSRLRAINEELQRAQVQLVQSAKMASLGELVAGIAHEINNPLYFTMINQDSVQRLLAEMAGGAVDELPRGKIEKAQVRIASMQTGLDRIRDIVANLRTFSRLDEGDWAEVNINEGIDSVLMLLEHKFKGRISIDKKYGADGTLYCAPSIVNQVVMNLVSNAIDAIEGDGTISIRTGKEDGIFCISVSDTGSGVAPEILDRIFEPFFTTKPVGSGTGLGLAISYSIVQANHGTIEVESGPDKGSTFTVRLPVAAPPA